MKETFNKKPYGVLSRITHVGNKSVGNAVPVIISPDISVDSTNITLEQLSNLTPTKVDESTTGTTYLGYFTSQSDSDETTAIYKIVESAGITSFYVPVSGLSFSYAWNNRTSITYKLKTV